MTIQSVNITNLYGNNYEWHLSPDVNILVGANGTYKSTILELIKLELQENCYSIVQHFAGEEPPNIKLETTKLNYYCTTNTKNHLHSNIDDKVKFNSLVNSIMPSYFSYSSGQSSLYNILAGTATNTYNQQLVYFLDNPENNLHINWQRNLIKWVRELNPTCQIIMTTHSPTIYYSGWIDKVTRIEGIKVN
jgi:predicted ATPase